MKKITSADPIRAGFRAIVDVYVAPFLQANGFSRRSSGVFFRESGDDFWRVACDLRKARGVNLGWATVSVCVGFRSLIDFLWPSEAFNWAILDRKRPCIMAANLGHLRPDGQYHEWRIEPGLNTELISMEIINDLRMYGFQYFEEFGALPKAVEAWEEGTRFNLGDHAYLYLAGAYCLMGNSQLARNLFEERIRELENQYKQIPNPSFKREIRTTKILREFLEAKQKESTNDRRDDG